MATVMHPEFPGSAASYSWEKEESWAPPRTWQARAWFEEPLTVSILHWQGQAKDTSSLVADIESLLAWIKESGVQVPRPFEIREYLLRYPDLLDALPNVVQAALESLPHAVFSLEVYHDPEIEDNYLVLYARFSHYDETTMDQIRKARRKYRPDIVGKSGRVILTTDFRTPQE